MKGVVMLLLAAVAGFAQMRVVALPGKSPLVTFRIVFMAGSEAEPVDKPGLAYLTAMMLSEAGTAHMTYKQLNDALFPMAASMRAQVDKEMVTFLGETHVDNLEAYYKLLREMLLAPGWREEDFTRVKDDAINFLKVTIRGNNDEELAKEVLYQNIYEGTPYASYSPGTVSSLEKITLEDVKSFYHAQYSQSNLILGIAGGYSRQFLEGMKKDFRKLPARAGFRPRRKDPRPLTSMRAVIVDKDTRSVAFSIGFPISVTRTQPDYPALLLAASYFGQHRMSGGVLYDEIREKRGLNYGDYAYIEYFPRGMFLMEPPPNVARRDQIFQIWIRPVEPQNAVFALRLALYEFHKLLENGISEEDFERSREFLSKYVNVLTRTKSAELGYAIDSLYYNSVKYTDLIRGALASLKREDVNRAIRRHFSHEHSMLIVAVSKYGEELKRKLASGDASPVTYNSPKPAAITEVDKEVEKWPLNLKAESIEVVPVSGVFQ